MKKKMLIQTFIIASVLIGGCARLLKPEPVIETNIVTSEEALTVARNWVTLIIQNEGNWGGSEWAEVEGIQEFTRDDRLLGYFCRVKPTGYIVISLRKELAPVRAYSETSCINPVSNEGMTDLIKLRTERVLNAIEKQLGPIKSARTEDVQSMLEINYRPDWEKLEHSVQTFKGDFESGVMKMNYPGGDPWLLSSSWHQRDPYNWKCPAPFSGDDCTDPNCKVGCLPLAAAQIMRYWAWPPEYDWTNMPNRIDINSVTAQINAVSVLCRDVGIAAGADYCGLICDQPCPCGTHAYFHGNPGRGDLLEAFEDHSSYNHDAKVIERKHYGWVDWFREIKDQLNLNRPLPYRVKNHGIVCDGWMELETRWFYHMNYGHDNSNENIWWPLDELPSGGQDEEMMMIQVFPNVSEGHWMGGGKPEDSEFPPYRYFDQDASGHNAVYEAGHRLQFLPGITVTCTSAEGEYVRFVGTNSENTRLFSFKGTNDGMLLAGIRIYNGGIRLYQNGSIRFH